MQKNLFEQVLDTIESVRKEIQGMSFDDAAHQLGGYNYDGTLFDYDYGIDGNRYLVGTILNENGKAYMNQDSNFYEIWESPSEMFATQILAMTENEIREQVDRLK